MKKLASILIIILYATTSSGASFHFHFCMGKFRGIGLAAMNNKNECAICGMNKANNGCCTDIVKTFKTFKDQSSSAVSFNFTQYAYALRHAGIYSSRTPLFCKEQPVLFSNGPPEPLQLPLFIRDRNFRI